MSAHRLARTRFGVGVVALTAIATFTWLVLWAGVVPLALGWSSVAVTSGSMAPRIESGDVILAAPYRGEQLGAGTVIVFDNPGRSGLMTHRVVDITPTGDYVTRGDASGRIDSTPVPSEAVHGVGRILVPLVGLPLVWVRHGQWALVVAAVLGAAALAFASRWALLPRFNPWRPVSLPWQAASDTISAILGDRRGPAPRSTGSRSADPESSTGADDPRNPRQLVLVGATVALVTSAPLAALGVIQAQAAFASAPDNDGNAWIADTLDPPTDLAAAGGATITLDWTATVDTYATGHRVYRSTTPGGPYGQIAELTPLGATSYVDNPADGTYYYVVSAFFSDWESANSNEATAVTPLPPTCDGQLVTVDIGAGGSPTGGADVILGTPGDDFIDGLGGDDTICGLGGDDTVLGGAGADTIFGDSDGFNVVASPGSDVVFAGAGDDTVYGGDLADLLAGGGGADVLAGGSGPDLLMGGFGDDTLNGDVGADTMWAQAGTDTCDGGVDGDFDVATAACETQVNIP